MCGPLEAPTPVLLHVHRRAQCATKQHPAGRRREPGAAEALAHGGARRDLAAAPVVHADAKQPLDLSSERRGQDADTVLDLTRWNGRGV